MSSRHWTVTWTSGTVNSSRTVSSVLKFCHCALGGVDITPLCLCEKPMQQDPLNDVRHTPGCAVVLLPGGKEGII